MKYDFFTNMTSCATRFKEIKRLRLSIALLSNLKEVMLLYIYISNMNDEYH